MFRNWGFLLGEIWVLLLLAALIGLLAGWLIWGRRVSVAGEVDAAPELEGLRAKLAECDGRVRAQTGRLTALEKELADAERRVTAAQAESAAARAVMPDAAPVAAPAADPAELAALRDDLAQAQARAREEAARAVALEADLQAARDAVARAEAELEAQADAASLTGDAVSDPVPGSKAALRAARRAAREAAARGEPAPVLPGAPMPASFAAIQAGTVEVAPVAPAVAEPEGEADPGVEEEAAEAVTEAMAPAADAPEPAMPEAVVDLSGVARVKPAALEAARDGRPDDLKLIKGIGPKLEKLCHRLGFYHFDQIANWTAEEIAWVDDNLEGFKGRVTRDNWVGQARDLAAGLPPLPGGEG